MNILQAVPACAEIAYIYDALGRLVGVIDSLGDVAVYRYDAVGNLVSISRQSAASVSIVGLVPERGPVGTIVTVSGTGFSATPSQNNVTFNGTPAVVSAATPTRLIVTVPASASTGPVAVTSPGGSGSSSEPFTVTTTGAPPTITSHHRLLPPPTWGSPAAWPSAS